MKIELPKEAATPADMRAEIFRLRREIPVVRAVMDAADYNGMSAEDRYTMLAYHALRDYARVYNVLMDHTLAGATPTQRFLTLAPSTLAKPEGYAIVAHPEDAALLNALPDGQWVILQRRLPPTE